MSRFLSYLCGPCGQTRQIAYSAIELDPAPAIVIDCPGCGALLLFPVTLGQALTIRAYRMAEVVELGRWSDAIAAIETPADLVGVRDV